MHVSDPDTLVCRRFRQRTGLTMVAASVLVAMSLTGCRQARREAAGISEVEPSKLATPLTLSQWHLLGPFNMPVPDGLKGDWEAASRHPTYAIEWEGIVGHNYLSDLGYRESAVDAKALQMLSRNVSFYRTVHQDGSYLLIHQLFPKLNNAVAYAVTEIVSAQEGDVGIGVGSDDGLNLWLNGRLLAKAPAHIHREARRYDHLCVGHLRRGSNFLVAKVDQKEGDWALGVDLMSVQAARDAVVREREGSMIGQKLLPPGAALSLRLPVLDREEQGSLLFRDLSGNVVWSRQGAFPADFRITLPPLKEGYYGCEYQSGGRTTSDSFFLGEPERVVARLRNARCQLKDSGRLSLMLDALIERYVQLNKPDRVRRDDSNWNRKVAVVIKDGLLALSSPGKLEWQAAEGWHFRRFISDIDGSPQDYLLYLPGKPISPIATVVIMPPKVDTPRPFLENALLTDSERLDRIARLAKSSSLALVLVNGRGNSHDAPIGESDVFEALRDIERDFPVDSHRLYLFGNCAGAPRALRLAAHHPGVFAAVATYRTEPGAAASAASPAARWWSELNRPENVAPSLSNVPVLMIHGDADLEYPLEQAREVWNRMRERGTMADFQVLAGGKHSGGNDPETLAFPFFKRQYLRDSLPRLRLAASRLKYADAGPLRLDESEDVSLLMEAEARFDSGRLTIGSRNVDALTLRPGRFGIPSLARIPVDWNGQRAVIVMNGNAGEVRIGRPSLARGKRAFLEGPIADVFAGPFEIVIGHGGDTAAQKSARSVAAALKSTWQKVFFSSCRVREESQVSDAELQAYHIVFVGKPARKGRFDGILSGLPLSSGNRRLSVAGRDYTGDGLSYAVLQPNPLNPDSYIIVIDSTASNWTLTETDLSHSAYYDFAVWNKSGEMIDSGLMDREWKNSVAFSPIEGSN